MFDLLIALLIALYQFIIGYTPIEALQYGSSWLPTIITVGGFIAMSAILCGVFVTVLNKRNDVIPALLIAFVFVVFVYCINLFLANSMVEVFKSASLLSDVNWWMVAAIICFRLLLTYIGKAVNTFFKEVK